MRENVKGKMSKPAGKVTGITRSSSGIGVATAESYVAEGAYVYDTGRRQKELDPAVSQIGRNANGAQGDAAGLRDLARTLAAMWLALNSLPTGAPGDKATPQTLRDPRSLLCRTRQK